VTDPDAVLLSTSQFVEVMLTYTFNDGFRYADFRAGERVGDANLTTLIVTGVAPAAAANGYFPAFWMGIIFAVVALLIGAKVLLWRREEPAMLAEPAPSDAEAEALMMQ
jgi:uncharacterized membrane-anchored protein